MLEIAPDSPAKISVVPPRCPCSFQVWGSPVSHSHAHVGLQCDAPEGTRHGTLPASSDRSAGWGGTSSHASKNFLWVRVKRNASAFLERSDSSIFARIATVPSATSLIDLPKTWPNANVLSEGARPADCTAIGSDCDRSRIVRTALREFYYSHETPHLYLDIHGPRDGGFFQNGVLISRRCFHRGPRGSGPSGRSETLR